MEHRRKRIRVDFEQNEISQTGRNVPVQDKEGKLKALTVVCMFHEYIKSLDGRLDPKDEMNIDYWTSVSSLANTVFNAIKQTINNKQGSLKKWIAEGVTTKLLHEEENTELADTGDDRRCSVKIDHSKIAAGFHTIYKLVFKKELKKDSEHIGTITTYLSLICGFSRRMNEVRNQINGLEIADDKVIGLHLFGLDSSHSVLLEGATFDPKLRSSMLASMGPMTIVCLLAKSNADPYSVKYEKIYKDMFSAIDPNGNLIPAIRNKNSSVIGRLAELCFLGIVKTKNKAFVPYLFLREAIPLLKTALVEKITVETLSENPAFRHMDFSGKGIWFLLSKVGKFRIYGAKGCENTMMQVVVHSVLGTHKDDLTLLEHMTGIEWIKRSGLKGAMTERVKERKSLEISLPKFNIVCKLATAAQTDLAPGSRGQQARLPVLSGRCQLELNDKSALRRRLAEQIANNRIVNQGAISSLDDLQNLCEAISMKVNKLKKLDFGTSFFYTGVKLTGAGVDEQLEYAEVSPHVPLLGERFWFQQDNA